MKAHRLVTLTGVGGVGKTRLALVRGRCTVGPEFPGWGVGDRAGPGR